MKKSLEKLMDLAEVLRANGYEEVAEELESYVLSSRKESLVDSYVKNIIRRFKNECPEVCEIDERGEEIVYVEDEPQLNLKTRMANMLETFEENQERVGFKDIVKYEEVHFVRDNVLSRWMVRGYQFVGLSNIEKCKENYNTPSYKKRRKGVKEKIVWMPRVEDFSISKWFIMLKKGWVDQHELGFRNIIRTTKYKGLECPTIKEIKKEIEDFEIFMGIKETMDTNNADYRR